MVFRFLKKVYGKAVVAVGKPLTKATLKVMGRKQVKPLMTSKQWLKTKPAKVLAPAFAVTTLAAAAPAAIKAAPKVAKAAFGKLGLATLIAAPSIAVLLKESPTAKKAAVGVLKGEPGKAVAGL